MAESKSSDTTKYLVDIDFSEENGGPIRLRTEEEVRDWQQKELAFWEWIFKYRDFIPTNTPNSPLTPFISFWSGIKKRAPINPPSASFHSKSKKAQAVNTVKDLYGEEAGIGALLFALGANSVSQISLSLPISLFLGPLYYTLIYEGLPQEALKNLKDVPLRLDKLGQEAEMIFSSLKGTRDDIEKRNERALDDLRHTEEAYKQKIALQAPVTYWNDKKARHLSGKSLYSSWLEKFAPLSLSFTVVLILGFPALMMWIGYPQDVWHYIAIPLLLVWTTTIFWAGRVLVRLFLSEHHLAGDAEERAVMAQTYLALVNEDKADKEDRHIVLETLFRHSTDGIVKDDAAPNFFPSQLPPK